MASDRELEAARRDARALLRGVRADDREALSRAAAVLGAHLDERFVHADALHVVARELGRDSWPALVAERRRGAIRAALDASLAEDGSDTIDVDTGLAYPDGTPVLVTVRRRNYRYMLDDGAIAVATSWSTDGVARGSGASVAPLRHERLAHDRRRLRPGRRGS